MDNFRYRFEALNINLVSMTAASLKCLYLINFFFHASSTKNFTDTTVNIDIMFDKEHLRIMF